MMTNVWNYTAPGEHPDVTVSLGEGNDALYTATVTWYEYEGNGVCGAQVLEDETFAEETPYRAEIKIVPNKTEQSADVCSFAVEENSVKLNGILPSEVQTNSKAVYIYHDFRNASAGAPEAPSGTTVSGTVKAYNSGSAPVVKLYANGVEKYTAQIGAASASGNQYTWSFTFADVAMGYYDLVVTKAGHLTYTIEDVLVTGQALDLNTHNNAAVNTISMLCGDIDGNGWINSTDLGVILQGQNYGKQTTANGVNALADLDGNGWINSTDLGIVLQGQHYGKGKVTVAYT